MQRIDYLGVQGTPPPYCVGKHQLGHLQALDHSSPWPSHGIVSCGRLDLFLRNWQVHPDSTDVSFAISIKNFRTKKLGASSHEQTLASILTYQVFALFVGDFENPRK